MKKPKVLHNFYKSPAWLTARELKIVSVNSLCPRCGHLGLDVHHQESLNLENVNDSSVSLKQDNLELLCRECHNKEHERFSNKVRFDKDGNLINPENLNKKNIV